MYLVYLPGQEFNSPHLHKIRKDCRWQSFLFLRDFSSLAKELVFFATQKTGKTRMFILKIIYRDIIVAAAVTAFYLDGIFGFFKKFF